MSVSDGEKADAANFNSSFMSREVDTSTAGKVDLTNADAASGTSITNAQRELNGQDSFMTDSSTVNTAETRKPTWSSDTIGTPNQAVKERVDSVQAQVETNTTGVSDNTSDIADVRTTTGTADGDVDMGTGFGTIITANPTTKSALIELETALEGVTDAMDYQGTWDANTNSPDIANVAGLTKGWFWVVSVAGTTDVGGITDWAIGDWAVYNGTGWDKIDNTDAVTSVNTQTGAVVLDTDDVLEGATNKYYTDARVDTRLGTTSIDALSDVDTTTTAPNNDEVLKWDGSNWIPGVGGGSGEGGINYITNSQFEVDVSDWNTYDDGAVSAPVDGTGGSPVVTISSGGLLRGTSSLQLVKGPFDSQGEGGSTDFSIDSMDINKQLFVSFDYSAIAPYVNGDIKVYVYDVTGATLLGPVTSDTDGDINTALAGTFTGRFQATGNKDYRLIFHITSTNASAYALTIDNVKVGPDTLVPGAIITEWQAYTPTVSGLGAGSGTVEGQWRRVGDSAEILIGFAKDGTPGSGATVVSFTLPSGLVLDLNKSSTSGTASYGMAGTFSLETGFDNASVYAVTTTALGLTDVGVASGYTGSDYIASSQTNIKATIPIENWSSGALLSTTETLFSTVVAKASISTGAAQGTGFGILNFDTVDFDTHSTITTGGSWTFTAPKTGKYKIYAQIIPATAGGNANQDLIFTVNATTAAQSDELITTSGNDSNILSTILELNKGDTVDARSANSQSASLLNDTRRNYITIEELPDFSTFSVYGETDLVEASSGLISYPIASDTWGDLTSISLPPGEWDITFNVLYNNNGAVTTTRTINQITTNSGTDGSGGSRAVNRMEATFFSGASGSYHSNQVTRYNVAHSTTTTYYLKGFAVTSTTNLDVSYHISARKVK